MLFFTQIAELQQFLDSQRLNQKKIGLVPTMGALHEGHLTLIRRSIQENDITVCSIYVNPAQFNNPEDLKRYPRKLEEDKAILKNAGCTALFAPVDKEMYAQAPVLKMTFGVLEEHMEGRFRKDHFNGVGIIVAKLFNIIKPDKAYFGQKDIQQFFVVKQLVQDLSFPIALIRVPTEREPSGLALSSRNARLTPAQREKAPKIFQALQKAAILLKEGKSIEEIKRYVGELFSEDNDFQLEYFEVADGNSLKIIADLSEASEAEKKELVVCIAVYLGKIRLIDNVFLFL